MQPVVHSRSPDVTSRSLLYQRRLVDRFPSEDEEDPVPRALGADTLHFQSLDLEPLRSDKRLLSVVFVDSRSYHDCKYESKPGLKKKTDFEVWYKGNTTDLFVNGKNES